MWTSVFSQASIAAFGTLADRDQISLNWAGGGARDRWDGKSHLSYFVGCEVCLERWWGGAGEGLDFDPSVALDAPISGFVPFIHVDECREADAEPFIGAHEVAFGDSSSVLSED